jgi:2-iminobutanoate/2-iminopropanoate deaminase
LPQLVRLQENNVMKNSIFIAFAACAIVALLWITFSSQKQHEEHNGAIVTTDAPQPIGPYSQAVIRGNALFVSGQIAIDPKTGNLDTADIATETKRVMNNIAAILRASHMEMNSIAKTTIYLTNLDNFAKVNEMYGSYFGSGPYPARETVEVSRLPKGAHIEISVTAIR